MIFKKLLCLVLLFIPSSYAVELNRDFQPHPHLSHCKRKEIPINNAKTLHLSGVGYAIIECIDPTAEASVTIYFKEDMIRFTSVKYEKNHQSLHIDTTPYQALQKEKKQPFIYVHIKIPYLNKLTVRGSFHVEILDNQELKDRDHKLETTSNQAFSIYAADQTVIRMKNAKAKRFDFVTRGTSKIFCQHIKGNEVKIQARNGSSWHAQKVTTSKANLNMFQSAHISLKYLETDLDFHLKGSGDSHLQIKGETPNGDIILSGNSHIDGSNFRISTAKHLKLYGNASASLQITFFEKKEIHPDADFENIPYPY